MLVSSLPFIVFLDFCGPAPERQLLKNSDFPQGKCIFSKIAQKRQLEANNQIKPQNLAKKYKKSTIFEFEFEIKSWFQNPCKI